METHRYNNDGAFIKISNDNTGRPPQKCGFPYMQREAKTILAIPIAGVKPNDKWFNQTNADTEMRHRMADMVGEVSNKEYK